MAQTSDSIHAGISSRAVHARTGKSWDEWFSYLDKAGAKSWTHAEIARHLLNQCGCPMWWSQMVTVGYEQARGLRVKHQTSRGFVANVSRTLPIAVAALFEAWHDPTQRSRWLGGAKKAVIRKAVANKSIRINWPDGTDVVVQFYKKGPTKGQVTVEHAKLKSAADVERCKKCWSSALATLERRLAPTSANDKRPTARGKRLAQTR